MHAAVNLVPPLLSPLGIIQVRGCNKDEERYFGNLVRHIWVVVCIFDFAIKPEQAAD